MANGLPPLGGVPSIFDPSSFPPLPTSKTVTKLTKSAQTYADLFRPKPSYAGSKRTKPLVPISNLPLLSDVPIKSPIITEKNGVKAVIFQQEEVEASVQIFKYALVARFHGERPSVDTFERFVNSEWGIKKPAVVGLLNPRHIMIRLESEEDFTHAWVREDNYFNKYRFTLFKWSEGLLDNQEMKRAIWVELQRLPVMYQLPSMLEQIGNNLGRFLCLDERTRAGKHPIAPRLCVELDCAAPLPTDLWVGYVTSAGKHVGFKQTITYDFIKSKCSSCKSFGHELPQCPHHHANAVSFKRRATHYGLNKPVGNNQQQWVVKRKHLERSTSMDAKIGKESTVQNTSPNILVQTQHENNAIAALDGPQLDFSIQKELDTFSTINNDPFSKFLALSANMLYGHALKNQVLSLQYIMGNNLIHAKVDGFVKEPTSEFIPAFCPHNTPIMPTSFIEFSTTSLDKITPALGNSVPTPLCPTLVTLENIISGDSSPLVPFSNRQKDFMPILSPSPGQTFSKFTCSHPHNVQGDHSFFPPKDHNSAFQTNNGANKQIVLFYNPTSPNFNIQLRESTTLVVPCPKPFPFAIPLAQTDYVENVDLAIVPYVQLSVLAPTSQIDKEPTTPPSNSNNFESLANLNRIVTYEPVLDVNHYKVLSDLEIEELARQYETSPIKMLGDNEQAQIIKALTFEPTNTTHQEGISRPSIEKKTRPSLIESVKKATQRHIKISSKAIRSIRRLETGTKWADVIDSEDD